MNGFAFAAIYKEPDTPGPGPHIDGPVIDDEDEKEKDRTTYTISGTSITPYVPFTVTVTASNDKGKGNGGHLQSSFNYEVIDDGGEWKSGTTHTWNLFTRVCDKNIQTVQFAWLISGREPVRATLNYNCGSMTPAISGAVIIGKTFNFSITFSGHGESCLARSLSDFGATYWWETRKNNTWERTNRIAVNQTPSFSQGVLSGVAHVGNLVGYDRIRLCVSYAGLATAYAEAAITSAEVTVTLGDASIHVWGPSTTLKIESESLQYMTAEFKRNGNATQDITDTNGDPISFTFGGDTWTGDIQAAAGAAEGTVKLVVKYGNEEVKEQEIGIVTEFLPNISVSSQSIIQGDSFDMTGSIASTLGLLSRVPANGFKLVAVQNGTTLAEVNNLAGSQEVEYEGVTPSTSDTVYVRIIDNRDNTIVDEITVAVQAVRSALVEAINERYKAKYNTSNYASENDSASTLHDKAIAAIKNYAKTAVSSTGTFTEFDNSNHGISTAEDTIQWYKETYNIVKTAVSRTVGSSQMYDSEYWRRKYKTVTTQGNLTKDENDDVIGVEDLSSLIARALSNWESAAWNEDYDSQMKCKKEMLVNVPSYTNKNNYSRGSVQVSVDLYYEQNHYMLYVDGVIDFYMSATPYYSGGNYDNCGHRIPSSSGTTQKTYSMNMSAGVEVLSDKLAGDEVTMTNIYSGNYQTTYGYIASIDVEIATYSFKHK